MIYPTDSGAILCLIRQAGERYPAIAAELVALETAEASAIVAACLPAAIPGEKAPDEAWDQAAAEFAAKLGPVLGLAGDESDTPVTLTPAQSDHWDQFQREFAP